jgi:hemolysin activation/secretion protein
LAFLSESHAEQRSPTIDKNGGISRLPSFTAPDALSTRKPQLPRTQPGSLPSHPNFQLPPLEATPQKKLPLSKKVNFFVKEFRLTGYTVFSEEELKKITQHYEKRIVSSEELQTLRHQLTRYYIDHGYINSGVILPDQEIKDGLIYLHVIEGEMSEVKISGNDWLRSSYIDGRMSQSFEAPLNIKAVQERLQLLQQDPLIERINAELRPGLNPGQSRMNIHVTEARPYEIGIASANNRSPSIGGISGQVWLRHRNLTGFGDALYFSYSGTEGLDDFFGSYSVPLTSYDTRLNLYYQNSEALVVENPIEDALIRSTTEIFGVSLSQPLYRTPGQTFTLSLAFEHRRSQTFINNEPFSFVLGVPEIGDEKGESKISVLRFTQEWLDRSQTQVIAARSTFNWGVNALDATHSNIDTVPDGQFFTWLGQFQWVRRLPWLDSQVVFRTDAQLANDALLPLEKFSIGGMHSVRGYRENQLVRDSGAVASLEWRIPVFRLPLPVLSQSIIDGQVQLAVFTDYGWSESRDPQTPEDPKTIGSWGLGVLWDPSPKIHTAFYWGVPFKNIKEGLSHDLQDSGIHFSFDAQLF